MTNYYVKNGGNNSNTGLSDAQAWETISHVNGFSFSIGDCVFFKCGSIWTGIYIFVDWNGTADNRVIIGAYYDDGIIGVSGNKPVIDGNDIAPVDNYDGLITIENRENITVENIHVQRSAGYGIWTYESSNVLIDNVIINRTYMQGNYFKDSSYCVLQYSDISETCRYGNGAVVAFWGSDHVDILYNVLHETSNDQIVMNSGREGINFLHSDYSTAIGNIIYDCRGMGIYFDHAQNALAEYNLIYYTGDTDYWRNVNHAGSGMVITDEETQGPTHLSSDIVIKNNLIANCGKGIAHWSGALNDNDPALINVLIVNNTIIEPFSTDGTQRTIELQASSRHSNTIIKNNIFWQSEGQIAYGVPDSDLVFSNNLWSQSEASVDTDVQGTGDVYGQLPLLIKTTGWNDLVGGELIPEDFMLQPDSPAIDKGIPIDGMIYDFFGTPIPQGSAPDIGAIEYTDVSDPCEDVVCPNICIGNDLYSQICDPSTGKCVVDQLIESDSAFCDYDPCEGVVCPDICIGNDLYSQKCIEGNCVTDQLIEKDSVSCKIPTDEETIMKYIIFGGLGLIGLAMLKKSKD